MAGTAVALRLLLNKARSKFADAFLENFQRARFEQAIRQQLIREAFTQQKTRRFAWTYGNPDDRGREMLKDFKSYGQIVVEGTQRKLHGPHRHFEVFDRIKENEAIDKEFFKVSEKVQSALSEDLGGAGQMGVPEAVRILQITEDSVEHINSRYNLQVKNNTFKGQSKFLLEAFKEARKKTIEAHRKGRLEPFLKKKSDEELAAETAAKKMQQQAAGQEKKAAGEAAGEAAEKEAAGGEAGEATANSGGATGGPKEPPQDK